jgi:hypothetical protein
LGDAFLPSTLQLLQTNDSGGSTAFFGSSSSSSEHYSNDAGWMEKAAALAKLTASREKDDQKHWGMRCVDYFLLCLAFFISCRAFNLETVLGTPSPYLSSGVHISSLARGINTMQSKAYNNGLSPSVARLVGDTSIIVAPTVEVPLDGRSLCQHLVIEAHRRLMVAVNAKDEQSVVEYKRMLKYIRDPINVEYIALFPSDLNEAINLVRVVSEDPM